MQILPPTSTFVKSYAYHSTRSLYARRYHPDVQDLGVELSHYCLQSERSIFRWDKIWRLSDNHYGNVDVGLLLMHFQGKGWLHCFPQLHCVAIDTTFCSTIASRKTFTRTSLGKYLQSLCPLVGTSTICPSYRFFGLYHQSFSRL